MELLAFTLLYGGGVLAVLFVLLCGEAAVFADTPVAWLHWAITTAPCSACACVLLAALHCQALLLLSDVERCTALCTIAHAGGGLHPPHDRSS